MAICADGQAIAIRLNGQVRKASSAIRKGVAAYNAVQGFRHSAASSVPETISEKDVAPDSSLFASFPDIPQVEFVLVVQNICALLCRLRILLLQIS